MKFAVPFFGIACLGMLAGFAQQVPKDWEVSGTATTEAGAVRGAFVRISGPAYTRQTQTDAQGHYSLKGNLPGLYSIQMQKLDNTSEPRSRAVSITNGQKISMDFRCPRGSVITGHVFDRYKKPIQGVVVLAMSKTTRDSVIALQIKGESKTNDLGEYRIPYVPEGSFVIAAMSNPLPLRKRRLSIDAVNDKSGFSPMTFYPGTRDLRNAAFEIGASVDMHGMDISLQRESTKCIFFKVDNPLADTHLSTSGYTLYVHVKEHIGADAPSLSEGRVLPGNAYEICGVPQGQYRIHFAGAITQPFQVLGYSLTTAIVGNRDVDLGSLSLQAYGEIRGLITVKDANAGDPLPDGIRIRLVAHNLPLLVTDTRSGAAKPDGTFVMPRVFADDYAVRVDGLPRAYYLDSVSQPGAGSPEAGVHPGAGEVRIVLRSDGASVSGNVVTTDGAPVADATVFLVARRSGHYLVAQSDQAGAYRFLTGISPGDYQLVATSGLSEVQQQDSETVSRLAGGGLAMELGTHESRVADLRILAIQ